MINRCSVVLREISLPIFYSLYVVLRSFKTFGHHVQYENVVAVIARSDLCRYLRWTVCFCSRRLVVIKNMIA